jgi:hypothetical protein
VAARHQRRDEVIALRPRPRQRLEIAEHADHAVVAIGLGVDAPARARIEHPGLLHGNQRPRREHDLAAEAVPAERVDVAELAGERADVVRARGDRVRRLAVLRAAVQPQVDQDDAPLRPPRVDLARDAAPVRTGAEHPVGQHHPARGRVIRPRDPLVMQPRRHAAIVPWSLRA